MWSVIIAKTLLLQNITTTQKKRNQYSAWLATKDMHIIIFDVFNGLKNILLEEKYSFLDCKWTFTFVFRIDSVENVV